MNTDLRAEIAEILGLEESPDGEPFFLMTYNAAGRAYEGADYSDEVEQLATLVESALQMHQVQFERANQYRNALTEISGYLYKRSKYGDEDADAILTKWYPEGS